MTILKNNLVSVPRFADWFKTRSFGKWGRPENFQFSPPKDFFGTDQFVLKMNEGDRYGLLKFKIKVNGVPDPPQFTSIDEDNILVEEGTPFEIKLFADDPDGQAIRFQLVSPVWDLDPWIELTQTEKMVKSCLLECQMLALRVISTHIKSLQLMSQEDLTKCLWISMSKDIIENQL